MAWKRRRRIKCQTIISMHSTLMIQSISADERFDIVSMRYAGKSGSFNGWSLEFIQKKKNRKDDIDDVQECDRFRKEVPYDILKKITAMADRAFDNRAGRGRDTSTSPYKLIYEGGEKDYGCLEVGMLTLKREKLFMSCVSSWQWVDDDPSECCDVLEVFATPVRERGESKSHLI